MITVSPQCDGWVRWIVDEARWIFPELGYLLVAKKLVLVSGFVCSAPRYQVTFPHPLWSRPHFRWYLW
jgi:hypothetical protein